MRQLFEQILDELLKEQETAGSNTTEPVESVYTPDQEKFLAVFGERRSTHLGYLYSKNEVGIQEFINRSGKDLNLTPDVFTTLRNQGVISIIPLETHSRDDVYTIQLNIPLEDVAEFKSGITGAPSNPEAGGETPAPAGGGGGGFSGGFGGGIPTEEPATEEIPAEGGEAPEGEVPEETAETPAEEQPEEIPVGGPEESFRKDGVLIVENAKFGVYNYQSVLHQTYRAAHYIMTSKKLHEASSKTGSSKVLNRLPKGYVFYLDQIINVLAKKTYTKLEREHLVADILDALSHNFGLTPGQILKSYVFFKHQNRLANIMKK